MLLEFEASATQTSQTATATLPRSCESGTIRLIRTACKAFERHGSEQSGRMVEFAESARSNGIKGSLPLVCFRGNRYNILFFDAAGI